MMSSQWYRGVHEGVIEIFHGGLTVGTGAPHEGGPGDTTGGAIEAATGRTC